MVFSSFTFLLYFLPAFLVAYFVMPAGLKNAVIFAGSLVFYYYGVVEHPSYILLMLLTLVVNYLAARMMEREGQNRKVWLILGLTYNFGSLFLFKYLDFFSRSINQLLGYMGRKAALPYAHLVLPIGISFYTFQISSYLIDVYREKIPAERSFLTLGTYLCMFPQLIAGPIVTYSHVREQLRSRTHSMVHFEEGLRLFTLGLAAKVLIANRLGGLWSQAAAIGYESISTPMAWLSLIGYSFQIYFDFYGYSLMAKGLGRIMGFDFPDNFQNPYGTVCITDFWRCWHMTLGSWFREYVYIPLGGNRSHLYRNLFVVWMLTGLWHGASWNFVLWGIFHFLLISVEKRGLVNWLREHRIVGHVYMCAVIPLSWLLFAIQDWHQLKLYVMRLFPFLQSTNTVIYAGDFIKYGKLHLLSLVMAVLCCTGLPKKLYREKKYSFLTALGLTGFFWACIFCMYMGLDDPFLYYQF